jgi:hypothetical protein
LTEPHFEWAHDAPDGEVAVNTHLEKESIMSITKVFRANAIGMAWVIGINDAVSRAVAEINSPVLTSLYQAKTGKSDKQTATLAQTR